MGWRVCVSLLISLIVLTAFYYWVVKKSSSKLPEAYNDEDNLPDLTFSRLADLETRLIAELGVVPIDELKTIRETELEKLEATKYQYDIETDGKEIEENTSNRIIEVIVLIGLSMLGVLVSLCLVRNFYIRHEYETDLETAPIVESPILQDNSSFSQIKKY